MENGGEGEGGGGDDYTKDGSVDLRGNPARRSKRGGWTACTFIVGTPCTLFAFASSPGSPPSRPRPAGIRLLWTACPRIRCARAVYELFERMAYYGIASNLIIYLTDKLHQGTVEASNNVTNWSGTVFLTPLLGAYVADAYLGRYWTFVIGSAIYFMVLLLLLMMNSLLIVQTSIHMDHVLLEQSFD